MFKIGKLETVQNESLEVIAVNHIIYDFKNKTEDKFSTLSFNVLGDIDEVKYSFSFDLNCRPEKLLEITNEKRIDFQDYILKSETFFTINGITDMDFPTNYSIIRLYNNVFVISINFFTTWSFTNDEVYGGQLELEFNLDDYLHIETDKNAKEITGYEVKN